jgi:hypothetical protein
LTPPRASSADQSGQQSAQQIAAAIEAFVAEHAKAAVLEDGKVVFELASSKYELSTEHERCMLHLWSEERNLVRRVVAVEERAGTLRLATLRFGQTQSKLLELVADRERRTPTTRETARTRYVKLLERVLLREFDDWKPEGFRTAMDLEKSFGPAYARGLLVRGNGVRGKQAWAVIGVNEQESAATIDGVLTLGILWLETCREQAAGKRLVQGLKVIVPRGMAALTLARIAWLNADAAQWELWELDQRSEEMEQRDAADTGNLRTRLVHHPDERAAEQRFAAAIAQVMELVPATEQHRVERRLRSGAEMVFLCHGLEFARAVAGFAPNSFVQRVEVTVGVGSAETPLLQDNRAELAGRVAELFARRRAVEGSRLFARQGAAPSRRIGAPTTAPAHARMRARGAVGAVANDPLYRAAPERWLESMLRHDLAPLTRSLAPQAQVVDSNAEAFANEPDPDTIGNRADPDLSCHPEAQPKDLLLANPPESRVIPRLDPHHVYAQVPAIAGASDRGLLDLLGVTADGRLAVIELKAEDDLHFALQGLDYWIRVRHHHLQTADATTGLGEFQRHGYFRGMELSPLPPRLYLVAPALHIHSATEPVLRYLSPRVEWQLLALDERWRSQIRVVWRKSHGTMR